MISNEGGIKYHEEPIEYHDQQDGMVYKQEQYEQEHEQYQEYDRQVWLIGHDSARVFYLVALEVKIFTWRRLGKIFTFCSESKNSSKWDFTYDG